jgi:hypothetical protein
MAASVSVSAAKFEREVGKRVAGAQDAGGFRIHANQRTLFPGIKKIWRGSVAGAGFVLASRLRYLLLGLADNGFCLVKKSAGEHLKAEKPGGLS